MRILKTNPVLTILNSYMVDSPQPSTISYLWNFGSLLGLCLVAQIVTGVLVSMHYQGSASEGFTSVEHVMRDVNDGWLLRICHANMASFFFIAVYLHIARGLYYGSYRTPRVGVWVIGTIIFFLMMATAFLGYVLPFGQMSLWGATVITNLLSAIPWLGKSLVEFVWGGFSVNSATVNRFFSLHFTLPFILAALVAGHLLYLHINGSSNPVGTTSNADRTAFHPYFSFKDIVTVYLFFVLFTAIVFYLPDKLGHSDNYIEANSMQTPVSIVPEWYLLPFYAILRSIPNKLLGVISMFVAILILLVLPYTDTSNIKGSSYKPLYIIVFWIFALNFLVLMWLGSCHVEPPFIVAGQIATIYYFTHYLVIVPIFGIIDNVLSILGITSSNNDTGKKEKQLYTSELKEGKYYKEKESLKDINLNNMNYMELIPIVKKIELNTKNINLIQLKSEKLKELKEEGSKNENPKSDEPYGNEDEEFEWTKFFRPKEDRERKLTEAEKKMWRKTKKVILEDDSLIEPTMSRTWHI